MIVRILNPNVILINDCGNVALSSDWSKSSSKINSVPFIKDNTSSDIFFNVGDWNFKTIIFLILVLRSLTHYYYSSRCQKYHFYNHKVIIFFSV